MPEREGEARARREVERALWRSDARLCFRRSSMDLSWRWQSRQAILVVSEYSNSSGDDDAGVVEDEA